MRKNDSLCCLKHMGEVMADKTLTRMDLSEAVFREVGLSRNESAQLVESVLDHMSDALVDGEQVKISSFGTFFFNANDTSFSLPPLNLSTLSVEDIVSF